MDTLSTPSTPRKVRGARRVGHTTPARPQDFLGSLKIWQKLVLIAFAFTLPLLFITGLLVNGQNEDISFAAREGRGLTVAAPLSEALFSIPEAASLSSVYLSGTTWVEPQLQAALDAVDKALTTFNTAYQRNGSELGLAEEVGAFNAAWAALRADGLTFGMTENQVAWNDLLELHLVPLVLKIGNNSGLILDPEIETYYVMDVVINKLPAMADELTDVLNRSLAAFAAFSPEQRTELAADTGVLARLTEEIDRSLAFAGAVTPELIEPVQRQARQTAGAIRSLNYIVDTTILQPAKPDDDVLGVTSLGAAAGDTFARLTAESVAALDARLEARIARLQKRQLIQLSLIALALALTFVLVAAVARRISGPVSQLFSASKRLSTGDLRVQTPVSSSDELGALATTFNETVAQLRLKAEADAEAQTRNDQLQRNIGEFLNTAMDISDGDFTKRGVVTDDVLGSVVDAINLMVEEVALLLTDVQDAALSVNEGAGEMLTSTGAISQTAQRTAGEAQRVRGEVQGVVVSIQDMARQADTASNAAARALKASLEGQAAVNDTLAGMAGIRDETRSTAARVQSLAARSAEISEIVATISHIASQTNLLALGAALEAAGAGDAGDRFAVVADEVRKLADESAEAAGRIDGLISTIQSEVKEVGAQVERNSLEVEVGYRLAGEAGERLREISASVEQSAGLAQSISQATGVQTGSVKEVGFAVQAMADLAERSRERVSQGQEAAERLRQVAERLSEALVRFRLV